MFSERDTPPEELWIELRSQRELHPYAMHKTVNLDTVEVLNAVSDEENHAKRWVLLRDETIEVWVRAGDSDEYGYDLQPEEQVSEAELEAIEVKHTAIRDGADVTVKEAYELVESGTDEQLPHALVALYYAAKAEPEVSDEDVDKLRDLMHEHTNHIDTSHHPTVLSILDEVTSEKDGNATT